MLFNGWAKIDELNTNKGEINQGFIAMSFSPDAEPIMKVFKAAIDEAGYTPMVISEKEHNDQIVPEIFYEIKHSKFAEKMNLAALISNHILISSKRQL